MMLSDHFASGRRASVARFSSFVVGAAVLLLRTTVAAEAACERIFQEALPVVEMEAQRTEKFRTGNRATVTAMRELMRLNRVSDVESAEIAATLKSRLLAVHSGLQQQNEAMARFRKNADAASTRGDCATVREAYELWLPIARARIKEYDDYFKFVEDMIEREKKRAKN